MKLDLDRISDHLRHLEETIIHQLIERAQKKANLGSYEGGSSGYEGLEDKSMFYVSLLLDEQKDAVLGRFCTPEERPFNSDLPEPKRTVVLTEPAISLRIDDLDGVNLTPKILKAYMELVPELCEEGDDLQYGSSTEHDVHALRRISERIHYGSFYVAESKFQGDIIGYSRLIEARDVKGLEERLTRKSVEDEILERVRKKVRDIQKNVDEDFRYKINPNVIVQFYEKIIIPFTKQGEVKYLLSRSKTLFEPGQRYGIVGSKINIRYGWSSPSPDRWEYSFVGTLDEQLGPQLSFKDVKIIGGNMPKDRRYDPMVIMPREISEALLVG